MTDTKTLGVEIAELEHQLETLREEGRRSPERFAYLQPARERLQRRLRFLRMEQRADMIDDAQKEADRQTLRDTLRASWPAALLCLVVFGGIGVLLSWRG